MFAPRERILLYKCFGALRMVMNMYYGMLYICHLYPYFWYFPLLLIHPNISMLSSVEIVTYDNNMVFNNGW